MPAMLKDNMEAINRYFMEQATVKTAAAEKVKQQWMQFWKDTKRDWTWYSQDEYDKARNLKHKFDDANAITVADKKAASDQRQKGLTSEELKGETKRAGTSGMFLEEEEPFIPTKWKVAGMVGIGLVAAGVFAKKILALTPYGRLSRFLP
jgi:hypothetical protein